jgi:hypothetical protein
MELIILLRLPSHFSIPLVPYLARKTKIHYSIICLLNIPWFQSKYCIPRVPEQYTVLPVVTCRSIFSRNKVSFHLRNNKLVIFI